MADIAALGIQVDSSQAVKASTDLTGLSGASLLVSRSLQQQYDKTQQATKAFNDNNIAVKQAVEQQKQLSASTQAANDNFGDFNKGLVATASSVVSTVSHLKLLALGAYALFPAFRSFVNTGITEGLGLLGSQLGLVSRAVAALTSFLAPAFSFLSRITVPIAAAVIAFKLLVDVWQTGSALLEKFTNAQRKMFDGDELQKNLDELTKFQKETLSESQINSATRLGARLQEAKSTINDILKVNLDLNTASLALQGIWVRLVELFAAGLKSISDAVAKISSLKLPGSDAQLAAAAAGVNMPAAPDASAKGDLDSGSIGFALKRARAILSTGLGLNAEQGGNAGGTFTARFNNSISDLAGGAKDDTNKDPTNQFTRLADSIKRATAAKLADIAVTDRSVGSIEQATTAARLQEAALQVIAKDGGTLSDYKQRIEEISKAAGAAAQAFAEMKVKQDIKFGKDTAFFTPEDLQIASALKDLYPDIATAMQSVYAQQLKINQQIKAVSDLTRDTIQSFASDFISGLRQGQTAMQAFSTASVNALNKISDKLMSMVIDQLWSKAFGGAAGSGSGFLSSLFGGPAGGGSGVQTVSAGQFNILDAAAGIPGVNGAAMGKAFSMGNVIPFARGGIVGSPTMFRMAGGMGLMGEAGPEAVMPLSRGSDGKLGVKSGSGSGTNINVQVNNTRSDDTDTKIRHDDGPDGPRMIIDIVKKAQASGEFDSTQSSLYGLRRRKVR